MRSSAVPAGAGVAEQVGEHLAERDHRRTASSRLHQNLAELGGVIPVAAVLTVAHGGEGITLPPVSGGGSAYGMTRMLPVGRIGPVKIDADVDVLLGPAMDRVPTGLVAVRHGSPPDSRRNYTP